MVVTSVNEKMKAIANEIRECTGREDLLTLDEMTLELKGVNGKITETNEMLEEALYGISSGGRSINDCWWDCVTNNNAKRDYAYAFYGTDFSKVSGFNPPYTLKPSNMADVFYYARGITKIKKEHINWTDNASLNYAFANCYDLEEVEEIEISSHHMWLFANCSKLHTIGNLILREGCLFNSNSPFANCNALENITLTGVILNSVSFQWSPLLTIESIENIISVLSDDVTGQTLTLNKAAKTAYYNAHSTEYANADEAWNTLVATKPNWMISLV